MSNIISGPLWAACNWASQEGEGSIHDDSTAEELGFRGGTVPGDVHMDQVLPVLVKTFGQEWFERGNLSLTFKYATVDGEKVQVFAEKPAPGETQTKVWIEHEDGNLVATGTAAMGDHTQSELQKKNRYPCDPSELRILKDLYEGMELATYDMVADPAKQHQRLEKGVISDPLDWYGEASPWGGPVACASTYVHYMWGPPTQKLSHITDNAVGLFSAIELGNVNGPFLLGKKYHFESHVISIGQSPQTEYLWFDTTADNEAGERVATFRMKTAIMKASSPLYQD